MTRSGLSARGVGIHGGLQCTVRLWREAGPVRFLRGGRTVPATLGAVVDTTGCTVLGAEGARVATVEHLLAALTVRGIYRGVVAELDRDELPILDGSAAPWDELLEELGAPSAAPPAWSPPRPFQVSDGQAWARLEPGLTEIDCRIDYPHPAIGRQGWRGGPERWRALLPARTFGFAADAERLRASGRAAAASGTNAIVFGERRARTPLRFPDEPVRHKALDALGDLHLLGRPIAGRLTVERGTHRLHVNLMQTLQRFAPPPEATT